MADYLHWKNIIQQDFSLQKLEKSLSPRLILEAEGLIRDAKVSLSFYKGSLDKFLVISGIVRDGGTLQTRISIKTDETDKHFIIKSLCECTSWNNETHCSHALALLLQYLASGLSATKINSVFNHQGTQYEGIRPKEYGTFINNIRDLIGASSHSHYSTHTYELTNKTTIPFPTLIPFRGKLGINFVFEDRTSFRLCFIDDDGQIFHHISVFECLYLFNWETGQAYQLSSSEKSILEKIRNFNPKSKLNFFINYVQAADEEHKCVLLFNSKKIQPENLDPILFKLSIEKAEKENYLTIQINAFDTNKTPLDALLIIQDLVFEKGLLSKMARKTDAYSFIDHITNSFEEHDTKKLYLFLNTINKKEIASSLLEVLFNVNFLVYLDPIFKKAYSIPSDVILKFIHALTKSFSSTVFRFSFYNKDKQNVSYEVSNKVFRNNLGKLISLLPKTNFEFSYMGKSLSKWSPQVAAKRNFTQKNWFDLEFSIEKKDMEIIAQSDLINGVSIYNDQIFLLNKDSISLAKIVKKYSTPHLQEKKSGPSSKIKVGFARSRIFELFELKKLGIEDLLTSEEREICEKLLTIQTIPQYPLPLNLRVELRDYQKIGHQWISFLYEHHLGACLADDMGLGKTIQTIAFLQSIADKVNSILIVAPVSILLNWANEIDKFSDLEYDIYHEGNRQLNDKKIILTSYGVMKKEINSRFKNKFFDVLIMDEVQHLKNANSLGAQAARRLNCRFRLCLTGTPVENNIGEFFNIIDLCLPGIWGEGISGKSKKIDINMARKISRPFILRRTKDQVLDDLPPKEENFLLMRE